MLTLKEFASKSRDKLQATPALDAGGLHLSVVLLSADDAFCEFGHYGVRFRVRSDDVVGVDVDAPAIPNPFGSGLPVNLVIKDDAVLIRQTTVRASELLQNMPFAIARPSMIQPFTDLSGLQREAQWLSERGIFTASAPSTYTTSTSSQYTGSYSSSSSNGWSDDSSVDDNNSDGMGSDDHTKDD